MIVVPRSNEVANQERTRAVGTIVQRENAFEEPDRFVVTPRVVEEIAGSSPWARARGLDLARSFGGRQGTVEVSLHRIKQAAPVMSGGQCGVELERAVSTRAAPAQSRS